VRGQVSSKQLYCDAFYSNGYLQHHQGYLGKRNSFQMRNEDFVNSPHPSDDLLLFTPAKKSSQLTQAGRIRSIGAEPSQSCASEPHT